MSEEKKRVKKPSSKESTAKPIKKTKPQKKAASKEASTSVKPITKVPKPAKPTKKKMETTKAVKAKPSKETPVKVIEEPPKKETIEKKVEETMVPKPKKSIPQPPPKPAKTKPKIMKTKLEPVVNITYQKNVKSRGGRGFSYSELESARLSKHMALKLGLRIDPRRKTSHEVNLASLKSLKITDVKSDSEI